MDKKVVKLGSASKKLSKAGTVTISVKLTATGKKLVKRFKKLPMTSTVVAKDTHNNKKTTVKVFTLRR